MTMIRIVVLVTIVFTFLEEVVLVTVVFYEPSLTGLLFEVQRFINSPISSSSSLTPFFFIVFGVLEVSSFALFLCMLADVVAGASYLFASFLFQVVVGPSWLLLGLKTSELNPLMHSTPHLFLFNPYPNFIFIIHYDMNIKFYDMLPKPSMHSK
jgi:hypothetical protein